MNYNKLSDLAKEIDYQKEYTYEQRVDIFNKYQISVSMSFINPIFLLTEHIRRMSSEYGFTKFSFFGMSHSGAIASSFNDDIKKGNCKYLKITKNNRWNVYQVYRYVFGSNGKEFKQLILFRESTETGTIDFKIVNADSFYAKRGFCFYESAEEFCRDFGFNLKFA